MIRYPMPFCEVDDDTVYKMCFYYGNNGYPIIHSHTDYWEFVYVCGGKYYHFLNNEEFIQSKNEVFLIRQNDVHRLKQKNKNSSYLNLCITDQFIHNFLNEFNSELYDFLLKKPYISFSVTQIFADYVKSVTDGYFASSKDKFSIVCNRLFMLFSNELVANIDVKTIHNYSKGVSTFIELLSDVSNLSMSLRELIEKTNYSYSHFNSIFKEEVGISPSAYLRDKKINYAKKLLMFTKAKNTEISLKIGFATPARFSVFFKEQTGLTPTEYIEKYSVGNKIESPPQV